MSILLKKACCCTPVVVGPDGCTTHEQAEANCATTYTLAFENVVYDTQASNQSFVTRIEMPAWSTVVELSGGTPDQPAVWEYVTSVPVTVQRTGYIGTPDNVIFQDSQTFNYGVTVGCPGAPNPDIVENLVRILEGVFPGPPPSTWGAQIELSGPQNGFCPDATTYVPYRSFRVAPVPGPAFDGISGTVVFS